MNMLIVFLYIILSTLSGYSWIRLIDYNNIFAKYSLSFLIGNGLATLIWFVLYRLGYNFNLSSYIISLTITFLLGYIVSKLSPSKLVSDLDKKEPVRKLDKVFIVVMVFIAISSLVIAFYRPISAWDALTMYDFRGKSIALTGNLHDIAQSRYYIGYPLMTSLTHSAVYLLGGANPQGIYPFYYIALAGLIFGVIKSNYGRRSALIVTLLIMLSSDLYGHSTFAYSNLPYTTYFVSSILLLAFSTRKNFTRHIFISGLLMGITTWTRSAETFWMIWIIASVGLAWHYKKLFSIVIPTILLFSIRHSWVGYHADLLNNLNITQTSLSSTIMRSSIITSIFSNLDNILSYLIRNIIYPYVYSCLILIAVSFSIILNRKNTLDQITFTVTIFLSLCMAIAGVVIFSSFYQNWSEIGDSARRMLMFITPLSALLLGKYLKKDS